MLMTRIFSGCVLCLAVASLNSCKSIDSQPVADTTSLESVKAASDSLQGELSFEDSSFKLVVTADPKHKGKFSITDGIDGRIGFSKMKFLANHQAQVLVEGKINFSSKTISLQDIVEANGTLLFERDGFFLETSLTGKRELELDNSRVMFPTAMKLKNKLVSVVGKLANEKILVTGLSAAQ